ncbi:PLAT/LH2 domain-containing protein [Fibrobacter sp. UWH9]|nr:PLAT/LH2 domain-containing protein [Fibrobacter sp. UWH9]
MTTYRVKIKTGNVDGAGTDAHVFLTIQGSRGTNTWVNLNDESDNDDFETGDLNTIEVQSASDLGEIKSIIIGHDNANKRAGWYLSYVEITNPDSGKTWNFIANRWLAKDEGDKKISVTLTPSSVSQLTYYKITIYTGEANDAGTDARVYMNIFGSKGSTLNLLNLDDPNDKDDFEAGNVNTIEVSAPDDLGDIQKIVIGHDNANKGAGWYLDGVRIQNLRTKKQWVFPAYRWFATDEDDGRIERTLTPGQDMVHYDYINTYPKDRENGWSEELNGVCHDESNWYFTQNGNLWKFPVKHSLNEKVTKENVSKGIYKNHYGKHLGDLDHYQEHLFVPVTDDGDPYIAVFSTKDIHTRITIQKMKLPNGKKYGGLGWVAINPKNGLLFTSAGGLSKDSPIYVYKIDLNAIKAKRTDFLTLYTQIRVVDEEGDDCVDREWMQGGCFDNDDHLHLTNGAPTRGPTGGKIYNHANRKGGITVYDIPSNLAYAPNKVVLVKVRARSNQSHDFRFQFDGYRNEPEGITYWDLDGKGAPGISGQLHVIMIDNNGTGDDDLYFKHYKKI